VIHVVRNTIRVLRGVFIFRLLFTAFGVLVFTVRWSMLSASESLKASPFAVFFLVPTLATALFLFVPGLQRRLGRLYLPIALAMSILSFTLESGIAYLHPGACVLVTLPSGREINLFLASTEMILFALVPCVLAGAAYGLHGAIHAATLATLIHLALGVLVWLLGASFRGFLLSLPPRVAVLYAFPLITGYLADTWRREHASLEKANRRLRGYAATVEHLATSRERVRLARAMHDTLAHSLSALVVQLEALDTLQETDPGAAGAQFEKIRQHARLGLDEARQAILDLRSSPVEELGLAGALQRLVERFGQRNGMQVDWHVEGDPVPLLPAQANALYRIAEEALDNVERHADASHLAVRLSYVNGVTLHVQDDGQGFDPENVDPERYGLVGIYERAVLIDGRVTVAAAPNEGTTLTVHIVELWEG
jgi:signal transduction histidine kinase